MPLAASPLNSVASWVVALPAERPIRLTRSLDGGSTFDHIATISEAWTEHVFVDAAPALTFPLYDFEPGE